MKFKTVASAAVLAFSGFSVSADAILAEPFVGLSFTDLTVGTITVGSLSDLVGSLFAATSVTFPPPYAITLTLDTVTFTSSSVGTLVGDTDPSAAGFSFSNVAAGSYLVKATGTLASDGQYSGLALIGANFQATPVPEPETYAMMLAGLGAIGFMASRRRRRG